MVDENTIAMSVHDEMTSDEMIPDEVTPDKTKTDEMAPLREHLELLMPSRSLAGFPEPPSYSGTGEEGYLYFHIDPKHTNYVNRILEGYEYVGVMTSVDKTGRCMVRSTPDTRSLAIDILSRLPEVTLEI
ncbi:DUF4911 domain-containing protein [Veillonella sp.]|uniref:DUF4911 domain-containing protein n=1 Tax=Veillonella sp. TaxID=1926307 RepID=UPI00290BFBFB|nr:DUF4911 domain-containing protein [Veillonella sp.]MDU4443601.1 DUF4911 domain-containing protein [Veillonella sp.]